MSSSPKHPPSLPSKIEVGDLVVLNPEVRGNLLFQRPEDGLLGVVIEVSPRFYRQPELAHLTIENESIKKVDRARVVWSEGHITFEPALHLKRIAKVKKST